MSLEVTYIHCKECGTKVFSRCEDDDASCRCGAVTVSGGIRPTGMEIGPDAEWDIGRMVMKITEDELLDDFVSGENQYGWF